MKIQQFYSQYNDLALKINNYISNYRNMSTREQTTQSVELEQSVNKFFQQKIQDDLTASKLDILA